MALHLDRRELFSFDRINILDNSKSLLFCSHIFEVSRSIDGKKPSPELESELSGLNRTSDTKNMKTKKNAFNIIQNILSVDF